MDAEELRNLPGAEIVLPGIADLAAGAESVNASAVQSAATRLARAGLPVTPVTEGLTPSHRLYQQLADQLGDAAHSRYNAILGRVASFARAAEIAQRR